MADVKICGITSVDAAQTAIDAGARFLGFIFYKDSPRYCEPEVVAEILSDIPERVSTVGVFVDDTNDYIKEVISEAPLDMIQLHGNESPERVREIRHEFSLPIIKVFRLESEADLTTVEDYIPTVDWLLFDTKPSLGEMPGGNGRLFDWKILNDKEYQKPWMLSGGLNADNIAAAIDALNPRVLDVSSGVEKSPGVKDADKIRAFLANATRTR